MNCAKAQRRLLAQADPARVPPSVRQHLDACGSCREWHHRLVQVEHHVPLLPVPSSALAKARLLRQIRTKATVWEEVRRGASALPDYFRQLGRWHVASGVAAALILCVLAWTLLPGTGDADRGTNRAQVASADPLLKNLLPQHLNLAAAQKPEQQFAALASMADELHGMAQKLGRSDQSRESLEALSIWFGQVVRVEVKRAGDLPPPERKALLEPAADRLASVALEAQALAEVAWAAQADHPLLNMADAARKAKRQLDALRMQTATERRTRPAVSVDLTATSLAAGADLARRFQPVPVLFAAAGRARAHEVTALSATDEVRRFQRNRPLIGTLVDKSLLMAAEVDNLKRAFLCSDVAESFAVEIQTAVRTRDGARAVELGEHLGNLLRRGVASCVATAAQSTPVGSTRDAEFQKLSREMDDVIQPLEEQLVGASAPEFQDSMQLALRAVREGRGEVEKALRGRGHVRDGGNPQQPVLRTDR